jgi:hypothetical protein
VLHGDTVNVDAEGSGALRFDVALVPHAEA